LNCPDGLPGGWLTVTPSYEWMLDCGQCASGFHGPTMTAFPSMTPVISGTPGTPTPELSVTPTPDLSVTPTPTPEGGYYWAEQLGSYSWGPVGKPSHSLVFEMPVGDPVGYFWEYTCAPVDSTWVNVFWQGFEAPWSGWNFLWCGYGGSGAGNMCLIEGGHGDACGLFPGATQWGKTSIGITDRFYLGIGDNGQAYGDFSVWALYDSETVPEPTPEPELTPTPTNMPYSGYCGTVEEQTGGGAGDPGWLGVGLPVPMVGEASCYGVGPNDLIDLWGAELSFPGFEICFVPFSIGELQILDVFINVDNLLTIMAGVFLFRMLLRS